MNKEKQKLIKLSDVPKFIYDRSGISRSRGVVYSWAKYGRRAYDGKKLVLKSVSRLGHRYTTEEWLMDFIQQLGG